MGGHSQARRIGAAAVWNLLLGAGVTGATAAEELTLNIAVYGLTH